VPSKGGTATRPKDLAHKQPQPMCLCFVPLTTAVSVDSYKSSNSHSPFLNTKPLGVQQVGP
jgi:hypothetical protein